VAAKAGTPGPKPLLDKLAIKQGMRLSVIGVDDEAFLADLGRRLR